ncbi:hypothetical protein ACJX0J_006900, partial [Zea mays]
LHANIDFLVPNELLRQINLVTPKELHKTTRIECQLFHHSLTKARCLGEKIFFLRKMPGGVEFFNICYR